MAEPIYTGVHVRIVGFSFGSVLEITGGTDVNVRNAAAAKWTTTEERARIRSLTVRVTGDVTHLVWQSLAVWTATFPNISTFRLVNKASIYGKGGAGGRVLSLGSATAGGDGGAAIDLNGNTVRVNNASFQISVTLNDGVPQVGASVATLLLRDKMGRRGIALSEAEPSLQQAPAAQRAKRSNSAAARSSGSRVTRRRESRAQYHSVMGPAQ